MKELELTSNAALTDAVYETALNGSFLEVKLVAGSVGDDEPRGIQPEYECYHISYPDKKDTILFEQPLDAADDKYNPQIQISAESETKRSIFRKRDKTKRSKKESAQHSKSRNKSFVMTSVSAL